MEKRQERTRFRALFLFVLFSLLTACAAPPPGTSAPVSSPQPSLPPATFSPTPLPVTPAPTAIPATSTATIVFSPTQILCKETQGKLEEKSIPAPTMGIDLGYVVYTPPCYDPDNEGGYPVVYEIHGQTYSPQQWIDLGLVEIADRLITRKIVPPFIIVMPHDVNGFANPYRPGFGEALLDELLPAIDENYRTCTDPDCRTLAGISRGGGWALYLGLTHPGIFGRIGGHSAVPFDGSGSFISRAMEKHSGAPLPQIRLDYGRGDNWLGSALEFEKYLIAKEIPYELVMDAGYHDENYWKRHLENYVRWYFDAPQLVLSTATPWPTLSDAQLTPTP